MDDELERNDFGLDKNVGEKRKLICAVCKRQTNHIVLKSVTHDFATVDLFGTDDFLIVQCRGCDQVSYCTVSVFSEDIDTGTGDPLVRITQLPKISIRHEAIRLPFSTPIDIRGAYNETSTALSEGMSTLAAAGTRLIVELICVDQKSKKKDLANKIDELRDHGIISPTVSDTLHGIRFFGNDAAHIGKVKPNELETAWQTINMLISYVYGSIDVQEVLLTPKRSERLKKRQIKKVV